MSAAAAPWSVKGIEPKAREIAKDLARRSGMTLGEWLNTMILEDGDDEGVVPLSRRPHAADSFERRGRSRRLDDVYGSDAGDWGRLEAALDAMAGRLEASERRSTLAIQGIDQAVNGLLRRLDAQAQGDQSQARRIDDIAEELREGHRRLRKFEQDTGPRTVEAFGKVESSIGALAGRLYDIEERQRSGVNELRQRMEAVEKAAGPGAGSERMAEVSARLDRAQAGTGEALRRLEQAFAGLDQRLRAAEGRIEPEGVREAARFEKLAEALSRQVEANRADMMRRLDTVETEGRIERVERAVAALSGQLRDAEGRSAKAVEAMGHEVLRIAQNLNGRVGSIEADGPRRFEALEQSLTRRLDGEVERLGRSLEQRQQASDDRHALSLERLGEEITRISDRLSERIAQSERRSQQALEDIGRRLNDSSSRIEQRYDRASGELAERMRLSEERTAALLAEARENIERRAPSAQPASPEPETPTSPAATREVEPDWRASAFPDAAFPDAFSTPAAPEASAPFGAFLESSLPDAEDPVFAEQMAWSAELAPPEPEPEPAPRVVAETAAPFGSRIVESAAATMPAPVATPPSTADLAPAAFSAGFGGADVSDALEATAPGGPEDDYSAETDFVDARALRQQAAARPASTRQALDAARAAMAAAPAEAPASRGGFGLKRGGGKSRLQERLDKQASRDGGTVRKALGASAVAVVLTAGGVLAYGELTGAGPRLPLGDGATTPDAPLAALAITPAEAAPARDDSRARGLYEQALTQMDGGDAAGLDTLKQAANLGYAPAQLQLAGVYQDGTNGVASDPVEARLWTRRAAEAGDPKGMHAYGMYLYEGEGGPSNKTEALRWLTRGAEKGLTDAQYNVARLYETGDEGIPRDLAKAYQWYLIAARTGDDDAKAAVARLAAALPAPARERAQEQARRFHVAPVA